MIKMYHINCLEFYNIIADSPTTAVLPVTIPIAVGNQEPTTLSSMSRYIVPLILFRYSCTPSKLPQGDYYGALQIEDNTFRLIFSNNEEKPSLLVVGFRGNEIPINEVSFKNDTLRFRRADMITTYEGHYDPNTEKITGLWKGEDSIAHPLTFAPTLRDTIVGVNPRTTISYRYGEPMEEYIVKACE